MATVIASNPNGPINESRLVLFEIKIGATLPADYRAFLVKHNGAVLSSCVYVPPGKTEPYACVNSQTFGLHNGSLQLDIIHDHCKDVLPATLVAIAEDTGGDLFCIGTKGEHRGRVYFWDHHHSCCANEEPSFDNVKLVLVTDSFAVFLEQLQPESNFSGDAPVGQAMPDLNDPG